MPLPPKEKSRTKKNAPLLQDISLNNQDPREDILCLLKELTLRALQEGQYPIVLKSLELWGKELGLFVGKKSCAPKTLSDMSVSELEALLGES